MLPRKRSVPISRQTENPEQSAEAPGCATTMGMRSSPASAARRMSENCSRRRKEADFAAQMARPSACSRRRLPGRVIFQTRFKMLALLLAAVLPAVAQAQFTYTTANGAITITGYTGPGGNVTVPGAINGLPVTAIGDWAFSNQINFTIVSVPGSVTNLGVGAFSGCSSMYGIFMPTYLPNIGDYAFYQCAQLTGLTIPPGVTNIGQSAFYQCTSMVGVQVPDSVLTIQDGTFEGDWRLSQATIGNGVVSIGDGGRHDHHQ